MQVYAKKWDQQTIPTNTNGHPYKRKGPVTVTFTNTTGLLIIWFNLISSF